MNQAIQSKTGHPVDVNSQEELEALLLQNWPDGNVEKTDLFSTLGITMPLEKNIISGKLGVRRQVYKVAEVAELFWNLSNYGREDDEDDF